MSAQRCLLRYMYQRVPQLEVQLVANARIVPYAQRARRSSHAHLASADADDAVQGHVGASALVACIGQAAHLARAPVCQPRVALTAAWQGEIAHTSVAHVAVLLT